MWEKVTLTVIFMCVVGYIYYHLFLLIIIKDRLIENCDCCNIDKHNDYTCNELDDKDEV